ncbi:hypothetical protein [Paraburkholderia caffeinilytica]|uniref:Uncharacterized protein n=1 Tax=Paraburkholderia caffeinilytica TaxID=1761016 RepID=A0ABQ1LM73_9BURK|nr:hypothetical protein [Paraburkholderia caffeinilytica]GGC26210.1 hypothetical protein GCM10011400_10810 [Paraburkholderia caffeinilytica]CAB3807812.1 hypothetical protein LMG28690_06901 [Paraburkholderia caffeinilytica]
MLTGRSSEQGGKSDTPEALLNSLTTLERTNGAAVSHPGARLVVVSEFVGPVLWHLTAAPCAAVTKLFRCRVGDAKSLMGDVSLPPAFHSMLLEQTNTLPAASSQRLRVCRQLARTAIDMRLNPMA